MFTPSFKCVQTMFKKKNDKNMIGWREWLSLPKLGIESVKAKIDTGARTSSLHANDIKFYTRSGCEYVKFSVHPLQKNDTYVIETSAKLLERRNIKDSGGKVTLRPVIETTLQLGHLAWVIELTLINRDEMGFRMLLGRHALKDQFLINPSKSFLIGKKDSK